MVLLFAESILVELYGCEYLLNTLFRDFFCVTDSTTTSSTIAYVLLLLLLITLLLLLPIPDIIISLLPYVIDIPLFISPVTPYSVLCLYIVLDEFNNPVLVVIFVGLYKLDDDVELISFEYDLFAYCNERIYFNEFCCLSKVDVSCLFRYIVLLYNAATCYLNIIY